MLFCAQARGNGVAAITLLRLCAAHRAHLILSTRTTTTALPACAWQPLLARLLAFPILYLLQKYLLLTYLSSLISVNNLSLWQQYLAYPYLLPHHPTWRHQAEHGGRGGQWRERKEGGGGVCARDTLLPSPALHTQQHAFHTTHFHHCWLCLLCHEFWNFFFCCLPGHWWHFDVHVAGIQSIQSGCHPKTFLAACGWPFMYVCLGRGLAHPPLLLLSPCTLPLSCLPAVCVCGWRIPSVMNRQQAAVLL